MSMNNLGWERPVAPIRHPAWVEVTEKRAAAERGRLFQTRRRIERQSCIFHRVCAWQPHLHCSFLPFLAGSGGKRGWKWTTGFVGARQERDDVPAVRQEVQGKIRVELYHAGFRQAKTAMGYVMRTSPFSLRAATPRVSVPARMSASKSARMRSASPGFGNEPARSSSRSRSMR